MTLLHFHIFFRRPPLNVRSSLNTHLPQVCKAIRRVDRAFRDHGLRPFHSHPRPHASVLWMLGSTAGMLEAVVQEEARVSVQTLEDLRLWTFPLESISCKIGQRVTTVWHRQPAEPRTLAKAS